MTEVVTAVLLAVIVAVVSTRGLSRIPVARSEPAAAPPARIELDRAVACDLLASLLRAGASVPGSLEALGQSAGEPEVEAAARMLRWGAEWEEAVVGLPEDWVAVVAPLRSAWCHGVDPTPALRATGATWRAQRAARAREAAERLSVRLVLPLGLCLLPAFVLLGLVPVALAAGETLFGRG